MDEGLLSSRSLNTVSHWSLPALNLTVSVMVATARHLVCLILLLYLYVNKAKATRPYWPVVYKTRFTASPSRLFQSFLEYLLSQICPQPVPHSFFFCMPWGLFPKNHIEEVPYSEPSASLLALPNPEILWCQRALWILQPHHVPSRGLEITSPPTLNRTLFSEPPSLKSHKVQLKAGSSASISWTPLS